MNSLIYLFSNYLSRTYSLLDSVISAGNPKKTGFLTPGSLVFKKYKQIDNQNIMFLKHLYCIYLFRWMPLFIQMT